MVAKDAASGKFGRPIATRFPPEPNGFPHIGHAKSICLNFGIAREFGGTVNLRFDDTNPFTEDIQYVAAIKDAVRRRNPPASRHRDPAGNAQPLSRSLGGRESRSPRADARGRERP